MATRKLGKIIIPSGVRPELHELETAYVFTALGKDVEFIKPVANKSAKTPDIIPDSITWEMKSPTGTGRWTIDNQFKRSKRQSRNLIIDIRRVKMNEAVVVKEVERVFHIKRTVRHVKLVVKSGRVIDLIK